MPLHAFVDESKRRGLLVVAVTLSASHLPGVRDVVTGLHLPGQRRIHFVKESSGRKGAIIEAMAATPVDVRLYQCDPGRHERDGRARCLARLVRDLAALDTERLVIERDESTVALDRRTLFEAVGRAGVRDRLRYDHMRAVDVPLLALPDAFAWCWAQGGAWRRRVRPAVSSIVHL